MGFLSAFLRGAAGQGVLDMGARWDRLDAEARAEARAEREREDRQRFLAEESRLRREQQDELAAQRALGTSRRSGSAGGADGGAGDDDQIAVGRLMSNKKVGGMDEATARHYVATSRAGGENPLQREEMVPEQVDEGDRMRTVSVRRMVPNTETWMEINRIVGQSLIDGPTIRKSNYEQYQKGLTEEQIRALTAQGMDAGEIGPTQGALTLAGKAPTHSGGANIATGVAPPGSLDRARIGSEGADAAAALALRDKRRVEISEVKAGTSGDMKKMPEEKLSTMLREINNTIKTFQDDLGGGNEADIRDLKATAKKIAAELDRRASGGSGALPAAAGEKGEKAAPADSVPEAPRDPAKRRNGQVYRTPKGLMIWRGTGWEVARGAAQ
jgi:hypothetical protein